MTSLSEQEVKDLLGYFEQDGNIYFMNPRIVHSSPRFVGPDSLSGQGFDGQAFFNPGPGEVGSLIVNLFEGPSQFVTDLAISKRLRFNSRLNLLLRADIFNLFNTVNWDFGDIDINSTTAGRITGTSTAARLVQFSAKIEF